LAVRTIRAIDLEPGGGPGRLSERWQVRMNADLFEPWVMLRRPR
jgi:hypothetical protein